MLKVVYETPYASERCMGDVAFKAAVFLLSGSLFWTGQPECEAQSNGGQRLTWKIHTVDNSSRGADGVRLGDVDKDGKPDIATGWEEGDQIRIAFQPKANELRKPWPSIKVGSNKSPEDAVFADVTNNGWLDVISCCEGKEQAVFFHLNPGNTKLARDPSHWKTMRLEQTKDVSRWMFCQALESDRLILGSKNPQGQISIWNLSTQSLQRIRSAGWIMSLRATDLDSDGDDDILYSDRKGSTRCVGWLEQTSNGNWKDHQIGAAGMEVMFLDVARINGQWLVACNTRNEQVLLLTSGANPRNPWTVRRISHPLNSGAGKAVAIGDVDGDGRFDLACTCGLAEGKRGVYWLKQPVRTLDEGVKESPEKWECHDISGTKIGAKFDRIELLDFDRDGDLDLLTCEERDNLGVVWYENPLSSSSKAQSN